MDDITRKKLEREREELEDAVSLNIDPSLTGHAHQAELYKLGLPPSTDMNTASVLVGMPIGAMLNRSLPLEQILGLFDLVAAYEVCRIAYDFCEEEKGDALEAYAEQLPADLVPSDDAFLLTCRWSRLIRNGLAETVIAIEEANEAADGDLPLSEIHAIAIRVARFMSETLYLAFKDMVVPAPIMPVS